MAKIISLHSFQQGVGKSNLTANLAALLAAEGRRVGVVDADLQSPAQHFLFGLGESEQRRTLNDYLWGRCEIVESACEVNRPRGHELAGRVFLVPASTDPSEIARALREGYDVNRLDAGFNQLIQSLALEVLLVDTHAGLDQVTLLIFAVSDTLAIVLRPDHQDYQGTSVTVDVARRLSVPRLALIVNKVPAIYNAVEVQARVEKAYGCEVAAILPHADEWMALASAGLFVLRFPGHPLTGRLRQAAAQLTA